MTLELVPQPQPQKQISYPLMTIQSTPQGVVVTIVYSQFKQEQILIAIPNAVQMCIDFIPKLPYGVQQDIIQAVHKANKANMDINRAVKAVKNGA